MNSTRILSFTICLGLACLLLTGSAVAGTTTAVEVDYALEVGAADADYTLPANTLSRAMNVVRNVNEDFILKLTLGQGAVFDAVSIPVGGDLSLSVPAGCVIAAPSILSGGTAGDAFVDFFVDITTSCTGFPTLDVDTTTWVIQDVNNNLGQGITINVTVETRDSATNNPFDGGTDSDGWLTSSFGVQQLTALTSTNATIDVATARLNLLGVGGNTILIDKGASLGLEDAVVGPLGIDGLAYSMVALDSIDLVFNGELDGIVSFTWDAGGAGPIVYMVTAADVTARSATLSIPGLDATLDGTANAVWTTVDGTTTLSPRTINISVNLTLSGGTGGPAANSRTITGSAVMTEWDLNGTILSCNFLNGNTATLNSRIYLYNASSNAGNITVRLFTLPLLGGTATELTTPGAALVLGSLAGLSAVNIKLDVDILTPLGIPLPYVTDGGNVTAEVTVEAEDVTGAAQVFASNLAFGTYPCVDLVD